MPPFVSDWLRARLRHQLMMLFDVRHNVMIDEKEHMIYDVVRRSLGKLSHQSCRSLGNYVIGHVMYDIIRNMLPDITCHIISNTNSHVMHVVRNMV